MPLVFVSHAHSGELLSRRLISLLRDALALSPEDFFVSSQEGRGVAPAASIRAEITQRLAEAPVLIVLLTPRSAGSPWVWLEAGNRLGSPGRPNPIFVVPSDRFVSLLQPVADLRCIRLDNDGELHELVRAVAATLDRPVRDVLDYKRSLAELQAAAVAVGSGRGERRARAAAWVRSNWWALGVMAIGLGAAAYPRSPGAVADPSIDAALNAEVVRTAARFLVLRGTVLAGEQPVQGASVMASRDNEVRNPADCLEPQCTLRRTTSDGEFLIDLTRIQAQNGDDIVMSVDAPGFAFFSRNLKVDVRAVDVRVPTYFVKLSSAPEGGSPQEPQP
jgi:hypothetical protein